MSLYLVLEVQTVGLVRGSHEGAERAFNVLED